jgi:ABC-type dipeptide/oligopeptide/nickel transport system permease subunit
LSDTSPPKAWSSSPVVIGGRPSRRPRGTYGRAWDRFRRNKVAVAALVMVSLITLFALAAGLISEWITGFDYRENHLGSMLARPGEHGYILGSDGNGRDILTRLAYGGRISLLVAALATLSTLLIGGSIGMVAGYMLGPVDSVLMRLADVLLSIPTLSILILISALYRPGYVGLSIFISLVGWPGVSRLVRSEVLALRNRDFVDSARITGASSYWIMTRHLLPNTLPTIVIWASMVIPSIILVEAALSFLGLGVRPPIPSWGNMLSEAQPFYVTNWTNVFFPGFMIFLTALSVNLIGNGLRDALDPQGDR